MSLVIVAVNSTFAIVDMSIPGGKTLEQHAEEARAIARLARLTGTPIEAPPVEAPAGEAGAPVVDPLLELLDGSAQSVLKAAAKMNAPELVRLLALEQVGAARPKVVAGLERLIGG